MPKKFPPTNVGFFTLIPVLREFVVDVNKIEYTTSR